MKITINGQHQEIEKSCSLQELIAKFCHDTSLVIAEHNGAIIKSPLWPQTQVRDGDTLELVTLVGGG